METASSAASMYLLHLDLSSACTLPLPQGIKSIWQLELIVRAGKKSETFPYNIQNPPKSYSESLSDSLKFWFSYLKACETMENVHQFAFRPTLLHVFISSIKTACFLFKTKCIFFFTPILAFYVLFLFPLPWLDACVCLIQIPVQSWSLNYGKPRRPYRPSEPTWLRLQVVYINLFLSLYFKQCRSSWAHPVQNSINLVTFSFLSRKWSSFAGTKKLQIKSWNSGRWLSDNWKLHGL